MKELLNQDLFDQISTSDAIVITTNCSIDENGNNIMGGGSAGAAARRWPDLPGIYGRLLTLIPNVPIILGWVDKSDPSKFVSVFATPEECLESMYGNACAIVAYPTMDQIGEPADFNLVMQSGCLLAEMADLHNWKNVCLAAPGVGIGGLDWETEVCPELSSVLDDRFTAMRLVKTAYIGKSKLN